MHVAIVNGTALGRDFDGALAADDARASGIPPCSIAEDSQSAETAVIQKTTHRR